MFEFIQYGADRLQIFILVMMRVSGLFVLSPILSHRTIPPMAKIGLVLLFSVLITATLQATPIAPVESLVELLGMAFKEILVGLVIGLVFTILFMALYMAGELVGYQVGFAMATVLDPTTQSNQSIMTQLWLVIATLIFLSINGHNLIISALADSYKVIQPGLVAMTASAGELIIKYTAYVFVLGLKMAAPVMVTLFLTDISLGVVAKMMPTMNVFFVGFPLKIGVGLTVLAMSLPIFAYVLQQAAMYLDRQLGFLVATMGRA